MWSLSRSQARSFCMRTSTGADGPRRCSCASACICWRIERSVAQPQCLSASDQANSKIGKDWHLPQGGQWFPVNLFVELVSGHPRIRQEIRSVEDVVDTTVQLKMK